MKHEQELSVEVARNLILQGEASCVVLRNGTIAHTVLGRGIKPILSLYEEGLLRDATVVDKIVGKAAASILVLGGVNACYGITMSRVAFEYLEKHGVMAKYDTCTEHIVNRKGDGICPMERAVRDIDDPREACDALKSKVKELSANGT